MRDDPFFRETIAFANDRQENIADYQRGGTGDVFESPARNRRRRQSAPTQAPDSGLTQYEEEATANANAQLAAEIKAAKEAESEQKKADKAASDKEKAERKAKEDRRKAQLEADKNSQRSIKDAEEELKTLQKERTKQEAEQTANEDEWTADEAASKDGWFFKGDQEAKGRLAQHSQEWQDRQAKIDASYETEKQTRDNFAKLQKTASANAGRAAAINAVDETATQIEADVTPPSEFERAERAITPLQDAKEKMEQRLLSIKTGQILNEKIKTNQAALKQDPTFADAFKRQLREDNISLGDSTQQPDTQGVAKPWAQQETENMLTVKPQPVTPQQVAPQQDARKPTLYETNLKEDKSFFYSIAELRKSADGDTAKMADLLLAKPTDTLDSLNGKKYKLPASLPDENGNVVSPSATFDKDAFAKLTPGMQRVEMQRLLDNNPEIKSDILASSTRAAINAKLPESATQEERDVAFKDVTNVADIRTGKKDAAVLSSGSVIFSEGLKAEGADAVNARIDKMVADKELPSSLSESVKKSYAIYDEKKRENERTAIAQSPDFLRWAKDAKIENPSNQDIDRYQEAQWSDPRTVFNLFAGAADGLLSTPKAFAQNAYMKGKEYVPMAWTDDPTGAKAVERVADALTEISNWQRNDAKTLPQVGVAKTSRDLGNTIGQFLYGGVPILAGGLLGRLVGGVVGGAATAEAGGVGAIPGQATGGMVGTWAGKSIVGTTYAGQAYLDSVQTHMENIVAGKGLQTIRELHDADPVAFRRELAVAQKNGTIAMPIAAALEVLPYDAAMAKIPSMLNTAGYKGLAKLTRAYILTPAAEWASEEVSERVMSGIAAANSVDEKYSEGLGLSGGLNVVAGAVASGWLSKRLGNMADKKNHFQIASEMHTFGANADARIAAANTESANLTARFVDKTNRNAAETQNPGLDTEQHLAQTKWDAANPTDQDSVASDPLAVLQAKKSRIQTLDRSNMTDTQTRVIEEYEAQIDNAIQANPDTISEAEAEVAARITGGASHRAEQLQTQIEQERQKLEAVTPALGDSIDQDDIEAWTTQRNKVDSLVAEMETIVMGDPLGSKQDAQNFQAALPVAREIAAFPDAPADKGNNGVPNGTSQRASTEAIYSLTTGASLPANSSTMTGATGGKIFGRGSDGRTIVANTEFLEQLKQTAPTLYERYKQYESRPIQEVKLQQQAAQSPQEQQNSDNAPASGTGAGAGSNASDGGGERKSTDGTTSSAGNVAATPGTYEVTMVSPTGETVTLAPVTAANRREAEKMLRDGEIDTDTDSSGKKIPKGWSIKEINETVAPKAAQAPQTQQTPKQEIETALAETNAATSELDAAMTEIEKIVDTKKKQSLTKNLQAAIKAIAKLQAEAEANPSEKNTRRLGAATKAAQQFSQAIQEETDRVLSEQAAQAAQEKIAKAKEKLDKAKAKTKALAEKHTAWLSKTSPFFSGVRFTTKPQGSGGFIFDPKTKTLIASIPDMLAHGYSSEQMRAAVREEIIHSLAVQFLGKNAAALWKQASPEFQAAVLNAYRSLKDANDFERSHEAVRFLLQRFVEMKEDGTVTWRSEGGQLHTETFSPNLITWFREALQKLQKFLADSAAAFTTPEAKKTYAELKDFVQNAIEIAGGQQQQVSAAPQAQQQQTPSSSQATAGSPIAAHEVAVNIYTVKEGNERRVVVGVDEADAIKRSGLANGVATLGTVNPTNNDSINGARGVVQLTSIAAAEGVDLTQMTREQYVDYAIKHGVFLDGDNIRAQWNLRIQTNVADAYHATAMRQQWSTTGAANTPYDSMTSVLKTLRNVAFDVGRTIASGGIHALDHASGWVNFQIKGDAGRSKQKSNQTHKAYFNFKGDFEAAITEASLKSLLSELHAAGYNGQLKIGESSLQMNKLADQMVLHGDTANDAALALKVVTDFFAKTGFVKDSNIGIDTKRADGLPSSYTQNLSEKTRVAANNKPTQSSQPQAQQPQQQPATPAQQTPPSATPNGSITLNGETIQTAGTWQAKNSDGPEIVSGTMAVVPIRLLGINTQVGEDQDRIDRETTGATQKNRILQNMTAENIPLAWDASTSMEQGAPIIRENGSVVAGNNRSIAIRDLMLTPTKDAKAQAYQTFVAKRAQELGLPAPTEPSMLVRVMTDDGGISNVAAASNRTGVQQKNEAEHALTEANLLPVADATAFYQAAGEPETMRNSYGQIDPDAVDYRLENAKIALLLRDAPRGVAALQAILESKSGEKKLRQILVAIAEASIQLKTASPDMGKAMARTAVIIAESSLAKNDIEKGLYTAANQQVADFDKTENGEAPQVISLEARMLTMEIAGVLQSNLAYGINAKGEKKIDLDESIERIAAIMQKLQSAVENHNPTPDLFGNSISTTEQLRLTIASLQPAQQKLFSQSGAQATTAEEAQALTLAKQAFESLSQEQQALLQRVANYQIERVLEQWRGKRGFMLAPNGKPTNLTERQWAQVRTPLFKRWFGDWENDAKNASKVIDGNGEPLVVYHGTDAEFEVFDPDMAGKNYEDMPNLKGMFFAGKAGDAGIDGRAGDFTVSVFLNIREPFVERFVKGQKIPHHWATVDHSSVWFDNSADEIYQLAEDAESDGVIIENKTDATDKTYIAFSSNQIKSATDNNGAFSASNSFLRSQSSEDSRYLELAKDPEKNKEDLQRMVDDASRSLGKGFVQRYEEIDISLSDTLKPHGLYTTPAEFASPHSDLGGKKYLFRWDAKNPYIAQEHTETFRSRQGAYNGQLINLSAGVSALLEVAPEHFKKLQNASKKEAIAYLQDLRPDIEWVRYYDTYEMAEGIAGVLLREKGYDSIILDDSVMPEFSERVALINDAISPISTDPVTYDEQGNIIPLSERFNEKQDSFLHSQGEPTTISRTAAAAELGRAHPLDEPLFGGGTIGDLQPGDYIFGSDGEPSEVIGTFRQPSLPTLEITTESGRTARAATTHLWLSMGKAGQACVNPTCELQVGDFLPVLPAPELV